MPPGPEHIPVTVLVPEGSGDPMVVQLRHSIITMIVVERHAISRLGDDWDAPGVYFLLGNGTRPSMFSAYVGLATSLRKRIRDHGGNREREWRRAVLIRKDSAEPFNTAEIGWLEGRFWRMLKEAALAEVTNSIEPGDSTLPEYETSMLDPLVEPVSRVLRMIGYPADPAIVLVEPSVDQGNELQLPIRAAAAAVAAPYRASQLIKLSPTTPRPSKPIAMPDGFQLPPDASDLGALDGIGRAGGIYLGRGAMTNLRHSLHQQVWGFPRKVEDLNTLQIGDVVVMGQGFSAGSPRVSPEVWRSGTLERVMYFQVTRPYYVDASLVWPDQSDTNHNYQHRIGVRYLAARQSLRIDSLPEALAEAVRRSAIVQGRLYVATFDNPEK